MQLLIWFVNSNIQNAFSTGIVGLVYGPVFPASLTLANDTLPPDIHMLSMAIMWVIYCFSSAVLRKLIINQNISANGSLGAGAYTVALTLLDLIVLCFTWQGLYPALKAFTR
jgi:hypothetical protein